VNKSYALTTTKTSTSKDDKLFYMNLPEASISGTQRPKKPRARLSPESQSASAVVFSSKVRDSLRFGEANSDLDQNTPSRQGSGSPTFEDSPGNSTGSDDTELVEDDDELILLLAKHRLLIKLMKEFYSMFENSSEGVTQYSPTSANKATSISSSKSDNSGHIQCSANQTGKRKFGDRDTTPPEDNEDDGRKRRCHYPPSSAPDSNYSLYACPFYKYDPHKYSTNNATGTIYRTCGGPGFHNISRLK
jgi:hypothetical protein